MKIVERDSKKILQTKTDENTRVRIQLPAEHKLLGIEY